MRGKTHRTSLPLRPPWRAKRERSARIHGLSRILGHQNVVRRSRAPSGRKYVTALPPGGRGWLFARSWVHAHDGKARAEIVGAGVNQESTMIGSVGREFTNRSRESLEMAVET